MSKKAEGKIDKKLRKVLNNLAVSDRQIDCFHDYDIDGVCKSCGLQAFIHNRVVDIFYGWDECKKAYGVSELGPHFIISKKIEKDIIDELDR